jgi:hypothetical protein
MTPIRVLSASEQVAASLREELLRGGFGELMPGAGRLTAERYSGLEVDQVPVFGVFW